MDDLVVERKPSAQRRSGGWSLAALPSIGVAVLPKLTCPVCWPAYTALLSSVGISFVDYTPYLLPTLAAFLAVTLWALAHRAGSRRGYGPFGLGAVGAIGILAGKFVFDSDVGLQLGAGLLIAAAVWNIWPINRPETQYPSSSQGDNRDCQTKD